MGQMNFLDVLVGGVNPVFINNIPRTSLFVSSVWIRLDLAFRSA